MTTAYESINRQNLLGILACIALRDGAAQEACTRNFARWRAFAVITLQGHSGMSTVAALQSVQP